MHDNNNKNNALTLALPHLKFFLHLCIHIHVSAFGITCQRCHVVSVGVKCRTYIKNANHHLPSRHPNWLLLGRKAFPHLSLQQGLSSTQLPHLILFMGLSLVLVFRTIYFEEKRCVHVSENEIGFFTWGVLWFTVYFTQWNFIIFGSEIHAHNDKKTRCVVVNWLSSNSLVFSLGCDINLPFHLVSHYYNSPSTQHFTMFATSILLSPSIQYMCLYIFFWIQYDVVEDFNNINDYNDVWIGNSQFRNGEWWHGYPFQYIKFKTLPLAILFNGSIDNKNTKKALNVSSPLTKKRGAIQDII